MVLATLFLEMSTVKGNINVIFGNVVKPIVLAILLVEMCETKGFDNTTEANDVTTVGFTTFPKTISFTTFAKQSPLQHLKTTLLNKLTVDISQNSVAQHIGFTIPPNGC